MACSRPRAGVPARSARASRVVRAAAAPLPFVPPPVPSANVVVEQLAARKELTEYEKMLASVEKRKGPQLTLPDSAPAVADAPAAPPPAAAPAEGDAAADRAAEMRARRLQAQAEERERAAQAKQEKDAEKERLAAIKAKQEENRRARLQELENEKELAKQRAAELDAKREREAKQAAQAAKEAEEAAKARAAKRAAQADAAQQAQAQRNKESGRGGPSLVPFVLGRTVGLAATAGVALGARRLVVTGGDADEALSGAADDLSAWWDGVPNKPVTGAALAGGAVAVGVVDFVLHLPLINFLLLPLFQALGVVTAGALALRYYNEEGTPEADVERVVNSALSALPGAQAPVEVVPDDE